MLSIQKQTNLQPYNTFGIQAYAKYFTIVRSIDDIRNLLQSEIFRNEKHFFVGGGSNILLTRDFDGLIIKIELKGIETLHEDEENITLRVQAGENWHAFVQFCVAHNYGGAENLSLIPGTVGAAPMQNIGAYGVEIKDIIDSVEAIEIASGSIKNFSNADCHFGYRESIFKQEARDKYVISSVTLTLTKKNHTYHVSYGAIRDTLKQQGVEELTVKAVSDAVIFIRQTKLPDPSRIGNAGSFFKNPSIQADLLDLIRKDHPSIPTFPSENNLIKIPAGWLIEQCGWKGKTFDNIGVHKDQALVLVNYGGGKGENIWQLAMKIQQSVREKFNITLQPEVNVIA
jgi:UDP-N-acetylmuramate dehydrogenase